PSHLVGTFPLPESQLDRFLMRIDLGYPDREAERTLLQGADRRDMIAGLDACLGPGDLMDLQGAVKTVHAAAPLLDYVQELVEHSRRSPEYATGLSPRAALALLYASRAWAFLEGRDKIVPEDVQAVLPGVAGHRLRPVHDGVRASSVEKAAGLISAVPIP
ncbi:MAG TPA: MoxR family ATPase, partial [Burkholderiales bacterium]|nr:MoxR family ATPase [Burkholderiales bacterium]